MNPANTVHHNEFNEKTLIKSNIIRCLQHTRGRVTVAARLLGIDRKTLQRRIKYYQIHTDSFRGL